jgi:hypothetical protein
MSTQPKTNNPTPRSRSRPRQVTLRLKVPANVWAAAKRQAVRRLEAQLAGIVTQTLRLAAKKPDPEGGA